MRTKYIEMTEKTFLQTPTPSRNKRFSKQFLDYEIKITLSGALKFFLTKLLPFSSI